MTDWKEWSNRASGVAIELNDAGDLSSLELRTLILKARDILREARDEIDKVTATEWDTPLVTP